MAASIVEGPSKEREELTSLPSGGKESEAKSTAIPDKALISAEQAQVGNVCTCRVRACLLLCGMFSNTQNEQFFFLLLPFYVQAMAFRSKNEPNNKIKTSAPFAPNGTGVIQNDIIN